MISKRDVNENQTSSLHRRCVKNSYFNFNGVVGGSTPLRSNRICSSIGRARKSLFLTLTRHYLINIIKLVLIGPKDVA